MSDPVAELARRGLELAPEDRARLAELLLASIDLEPASEVESAWNEEILRRLAAYDRGQSQAVAAEEVFAKATAIAR